ncbi:MAG: 4-(cytidine 5'-diphospho)-2-C-methyl-D-erythritol kinase [bacterium]
MRNIVIKAPAKVNTILRVVGRRPNGYHDLEMVMVPLTLCDEITLTSIPSGVELSVDGSADAGMHGDKNLACRAASAMLEASGRSDGVRIELRKRIPVAAGLGGGSSDAASVLRGLNELWGLGLSPEGLAEIGVTLGADVPFFCHHRPAYVEGIGDRVTPYESFPNLSFLLINPGFAVSTPWVYSQWDLQLTVKLCGARVRPLFQGVSDVLASLHNDLERVTIPAHPEIEVIKGALMGAGAAGALMSGSGPTVFGAFVDIAARDRARERLENRRWRIFAAERA